MRSWACYCADAAIESTLPDNKRLGHWCLSATLRSGSRDTSSRVSQILCYRGAIGVRDPVGFGAFNRFL